MSNVRRFQDGVEVYFMFHRKDGYDMRIVNEKKLCAPLWESKIELRLTAENYATLLSFPHKELEHMIPALAFERGERECKKMFNALEMNSEFSDDHTPADIINEAIMALKGDLDNE